MFIQFAVRPMTIAKEVMFNYEVPLHTDTATYLVHLQFVTILLENLDLHTFTINEYQFVKRHPSTDQCQNSYHGISKSEELNNENKFPVVGHSRIVPPLSSWLPLPTSNHTTELIIGFRYLSEICPAGCNLLTYSWQIFESVKVLEADSGFVIQRNKL